MATLEHTHYFKLDLGDEVFEFGSRTVPISITGITKIYSVKQLVADNYTTEVLWCDGDGGMDKEEWSYLVFVSDADVVLQLRNDAASPERVAFHVTAGRPLILHNGEFQGDDDDVDILTLANPLTTLESTDEISVKRDVADTIGNANVTLYLFG